MLSKDREECWTDRGTSITQTRILSEETQYTSLLKRILEEGFLEEGRNGETKSIFGHTMRFSLSDGKIPILTTKRVAWKTCLKELLWFIKGQTDNKILKEQGVHIWDANGSREFLNLRGLTDYPEDLLGPIYGFQWRNFNGYYPYEKDFMIDKNKSGVDQLQNIIDDLKDPTQRTSRRLILSAWNPQQVNQMALPPCHIMCQFFVHSETKLSCAMYQRSNDECCGTPFNIASYSFLTHLLAKHCGLEAHEFVYFKGSCHIYTQHLEGALEQMNREPFPFPTLQIKTIRNNIEEYEVDDFIVSNYKSHPVIKYEMIA